MKTYYLPTAVVVGLLVLALLGFIWPMTQRSAVGERIETVGETEEVAKDIEAIDVDVVRDLEGAKALVKAFGARQSYKAEPTADPFAAPVENVAALQQPPPPPPDVVGETGEEGTAVEPPTPPRRMRWPLLKLEGVALAGKNAVALIDGELYETNGTVQGVRIAQIGEQEVLLVAPNGERRVLVLEGWNGKEKNDE